MVTGLADSPMDVGFTSKRSGDLLGVLSRDVNDRIPLQFRRVLRPLCRE